MRAGTFGRTVGRAVAIALFGLTVTVAGIVGVQAAEGDDWSWDVNPAGTQDSENGGWASIIADTAATASDWSWD